MRKPVANKTCFYIRLALASVEEETGAEELLLEALGALGKIRDRGRGTAKDPMSIWYEVEVREKYVECVRETLHKWTGIPHDRLVEVFPVDRGEGKLQARQLTLV